MRWESVYRLMQSHVILLCVPDTDVIPFQPWETMIHFQMDLVYQKKYGFILKEERNTSMNITSDHPQPS